LGRNFLERFRRFAAADATRRREGRRLKIKDANVIKADDSTENAKNADGRRRIGQVGANSTKRLAKPFGGIERPKLTVYSPKFKRYFRLVQQAPRKLLPFRAFFSIFDADANNQFCPFCANLLFFDRPRRRSARQFFRFV